MQHPHHQQNNYSPSTPHLPFHHTFDNSPGPPADLAGPRFLDYPPQAFYPATAYAYSNPFPPSATPPELTGLHHPSTSSVVGSNGFASCSFLGVPSLPTKSASAHHSNNPLPTTEVFPWMRDSKQNRSGRSRGRKKNGNNSHEDYPSRSSHNNPCAQLSHPSSATDDLISKRPRVNYTTKQQVELEKEFRTTQYLSKSRRSDLSSSLELSERQIKIWFQNRRMKEKKRQKYPEQSGLAELINSETGPATPINDGIMVTRLPISETQTGGWKSPDMTTNLDGGNFVKLEETNRMMESKQINDSPPLSALQKAFESPGT